MLNTTSSSRFFLCKKNSCGNVYRKICSHCKSFLYFFTDIFSIGEMYPNSRKRTTGKKISWKKSIQYIQKEKGFLKNNMKVIRIMLWILGSVCRKKILNGTLSISVDNDVFWCINVFQKIDKKRYFEYTYSSFYVISKKCTKS